MHTYMIDIENVMDINLMIVSRELIELFVVYQTILSASYEEETYRVRLTFDAYPDTDCQLLIRFIETAYNQPLHQMRVRIVRRA